MQRAQPAVEEPPPPTKVSSPSKCISVAPLLSLSPLLGLFFLFFVYCFYFKRVTILNVSPNPSMVAPSKSRLRCQIPASVRSDMVSSRPPFLQLKTVLHERCGTLVIITVITLDTHLQAILLAFFFSNIISSISVPAVPRSRSEPQLSCSHLPITGFPPTQKRGEGAQAKATIRKTKLSPRSGIYCE